MEIEQQLEKAARRFDELNERLQDPAVLGNANRLAEVMREYKQLEPIVSCYRERQDADMQLHDLYAMLQTEQDPDMRRMVTEEMQALQASVEQANGTMESLLQPMDAQDDRSVIVEIRSGAGGEESTMLAHSWYRVYSREADRGGLLPDQEDRPRKPFGDPLPARLVQMPAVRQTFRGLIFRYRAVIVVDDADAVCHGDIDLMEHIV